MNTKLKFIAYSLLGFTSISIASTKFFTNTAINVNDNGGILSSRYSISINQAGFSPHSNTMHHSGEIQEINKPIWTINIGQLPITDHDCNVANIDTCDEGSTYCYNHCLVSADPNVVAFDEKSNKIYFLTDTVAIGTGGGPAFLFVADINKKEVKLLHDEETQEQGSLSPSGRYLLMHSYNVIKMYDAQQNYIRTELNKSENIYTENKDIRHKLFVKKWLNDTQFMYVDIARYFVRPIPESGEPFFSAKEVVYDVVSRKILSQRLITKEQADAYEKTL